MRTADQGGSPLDAIRRVLRFMDAREKHYARRPMPKGSERVHPDSIHAEYGRLDMADLRVLVTTAHTVHSGGES